MDFFAEVSDSDTVARGRKKKVYDWAKINSLLPSKVIPVSFLSVLEKQSFSVCMGRG